MILKYPLLFQRGECFNKATITVVSWLSRLGPPTIGSILFPAGIPCRFKSIWYLGHIKINLLFQISGNTEAMGRAWLRIVLRKHFCGKSSCQRKILTLKAAFVNNWIKCSVIHNNIMSRSWTYITTLIFWPSIYDQNDHFRRSKFSLFPYNSVSRLLEVPDQKVVRIDMILNQELPSKRELNTFQNPWKNNFFYCVELKMPIFQLFYSKKYSSFLVRRYVNSFLTGLITVFLQLIDPL